MNKYKESRTKDILDDETKELCKRLENIFIIRHGLSEFKDYKLTIDITSNVFETTHEKIL